MDTSLYYNPNKLLSYNRLMNFVIGARGIGKSYAFKIHPIKRFLKHGEQFVYIRRYKEELRKIQQYFSDVAHEFPGVEFEVKGREFYINGEQAGFAIPLSQWQKEKSTSYPNVTTIIFDEFIRQKDTSRYLPNEVEALLNLIDTIIRTRDNARVICLSNAVTITNPYFIYFKLTPDIERRFNAYDEIIVEIPDSADFSEQRKKTKFGKLIKGTNYGDMAMDNEFTEDSQVFIERRSKDSKFKFAFVYKGSKYGVWLDVTNGMMYISEKYDPSGRHVFSLTMDDLNSNSVYMRAYSKNYMLKNMIEFFKLGAVRFDNQKVKNKCYEMFQDMNVQ